MADTMMEPGSDDRTPVKARKKRIPKACEPCRHSKVKCNGQRPCSRCHALKKTCTFEEPPKDDRDRRIESLEDEVESLRGQLQWAHVPPLSRPSIVADSLPISEQSSRDPRGEQHDKPAAIQPPNSLLEPSTGWTPNPSAAYGSIPQPLSSTSPVEALSISSNFKKRKRSHFEVVPIATPDFLTMGLISLADAESYFNTFFQGCHHYVPVFDPRFDSFSDIRKRSGILFSAICAAGCRILKGADSRPGHQLNFHIKRILNSVLGSPSTTSVETIQALMVRACYASERSLLVTVATRLAIDIGLPEAYEHITARSVGRPAEPFEDNVALMRKTRTWLHLLNTVHILHVDAGDLLKFRFRGDVRRCRLLVETPDSTMLDLHLISQLELNVLRANTYAELIGSITLTDDEMMEVIRDAKVDIEVWFNDWMRIFERWPDDKPWLALRLRVQQCWADTMAMCRAVSLSGVENIHDMSQTQRNILSMAKDSLQEHLSIIIEEPREYLRNLRFAMDFVWAKCAFCFLLLLKFSLLLALDDEQAKRKLVQDGNVLLAELRGISGNGVGPRSNTSRVYLRLLKTGLEKFSRTALSENLSSKELPSTGTSTPRQRGDTSTPSGDHNELESFVPEQFVFEWDFPGLTLFSSPTNGSAWFDDLLQSALAGGDGFWLGWNTADFAE